MKVRYGYVSNSSSSSYVIINWKELDDVKKRMIIDYCECALALWKDNGIVIDEKYNSPKISPDHPLNFGFADNSWRFREKDGVLDAVASVDNFDLGKWMDYIGGITYRHCGESYGLFDDEEPAINHELLDMLLKEEKP